MYVIITALPSNIELYSQHLKRGESRNPNKFTRKIGREIDPGPYDYCPDIRIEFRPDRHTVLWTTHKYAHYYWFKSIAGERSVPQASNVYVKEQNMRQQPYLQRLFTEEELALLIQGLRIVRLPMLAHIQTDLLKELEQQLWNRFGKKVIWR